jgi:hypothetical protein
VVVVVVWVGLEVQPRSVASDAAIAAQAKDTLWRLTLRMPDLCAVVLVNVWSIPVLIYAS